jgi:hypothetical protein
LAGLKDIIEGDGETERRYVRLLSETSGSPSAAMLQSDINRDVLPGRKSEWAKDLPASEAAKLDRYAWGRQAGLGGIPTALYSEAVKVPAIQGAMRHVTRGIGKVTGFPEAEKWYDTDETSSPPSLGNVGSYIRGAISPDESEVSFAERVKRMLLGRS